MSERKRSGLSGYVREGGPLNHRQVCAAYRATPRRTVADLAAEFGVSPQRISAIAKANGLSREKPRRGVITGKAPKYTDYGLASLKHRNLICLALLRPAARTHAEIAELLGMTEGATSTMSLTSAMQKLTTKRLT